MLMYVSHTQACGVYNCEGVSRRGEFMLQEVWFEMHRAPIKTAVGILQSLGLFHHLPQSSVGWVFVGNFMTGV